VKSHNSFTEAAEAVQSNDSFTERCHRCNHRAVATGGGIGAIADPQRREGARAPVRELVGDDGAERLGAPLAEDVDPALRLWGALELFPGWVRTRKSYSECERTEPPPDDSFRDRGNPGAQQ
jgi:hypothetical protein